MRFTFLGTSSGTPTLERNVSSAALRFDSGKVWLFDCGEGTQHQILRTDLRPGRIERILLTHLHGDHCFGLPGLIYSTAIHGRKKPLEIVGPVGVREFVETAIRTGGGGEPVPLRFVELDGAAELPELSRIRVRAVPIEHRVECYGYSLHEPPPSRVLNVEAARRLGVPDGPMLGRLKEGEDVVLADGRTVRSSSVLGPERRGRHVVVLGDTSDPSAIVDAATGCDLLVHEATFLEKLRANAEKWGHSTGRMAGRFAARVRARTLVLNHFSPRYSDIAAHSVQDLVEEAQAECPATHVVASADLWQCSVRAD